MDGGQIVKQHDQLKAERGTWDSTYQSIADYMLGTRDFNTEHVTGGRSRQRVIYDGTARFSISALSGGLHSLMTNPSAEWFNIITEDSRLMQDHDVALWMEDTQEQLYNAFNRPEARFSPQIHESYTEIVAFGTNGFFVEDVPGVGPMFSSRTLSELYASENQYGAIDTISREFRFAARQAVEKWGDNAPKKARTAVDEGKSEESHKYIHMVRPASSPMPMPFRPSGMPFESAYVALEDKSIVQHGGYEEMPYMMSRWEKDPSEVYGRGPGFVALPDATMLNEMKKTMLQAGVLKVRPPLITEDDEVMLDLRPGAKNVVRAGSMNPGVQPLNTGGDLGWGVELLNDTRQQVQNAFHWDLLQLIRDPRMTATQVMEISGQIMRLMAPVLGRQTTEFLDPIVHRVFGILSRSGRLLPPPPALAGTNLKVEYISPVARAQKNNDTNAIVEVFTVGANLAQSDPSVLDVMDSEEAMRLIATQKGVPTKVLKSREVVQQIREARAEAQQQQAQQQQALQQAEAIAKLAPALQGAQGAG